jgi:hypothetical protein
MSANFLPSVQNNPYAKVTYLGVHILIPFSCYQCLCVGFYVNINFQFILVNTWEHKFWIIGKTIFNFGIE